MAPDWRLLHHSSFSTSVPPLLVKYEFGTSRYKIWVTDLTHIWVEALDQRQLIQRAWDIDTDIDPVEADQRQMLLKRIEDSLDGVKDTKLVISKGATPNGFILTAHSPLPKPLKPLEWPFRLVVASPITLTNELILPLLANQMANHEQISSLLTIVKNKDYVIGKLVDHMEAGGIELGLVFPHAASSKHSRKANSREDVGKVVQGLETFDEHQWRFQCASDHDVPRDGKNLLSQLSGHGDGLGSFSISEQSDFGPWWENLGDGGLVQNADENKTPFISQSQTSAFQTSAAEDFQVGFSPKLSCTGLTSLLQRQATPDHLKYRAAGGRPSPEQMTLPQRTHNSKTIAPEGAVEGSATDASDDDSDTDDGDLESMQPMTRETQQVSKQSSSSRSPSPDPVSKASGNPPPKPKGMLGRIGGATKQGVSPTKPKLGHIGAASESAKPLKLPSKSPEPTRGRRSEESRSPSPQRETSQERADRKREMLKRELEEKSRLGVKKKRKF